jgi:hypothetical protein
MDEMDLDNAREDRARHIRDTIYAYKRLFATEDGQTVLNDIRKAFGVDMPAYLPTNTRVGGNIQYDDIYGKIRDGQRSVWCHIQNAINAEIDPSGNLNKTPQVLTGLRGQP